MVNAFLDGTDSPHGFFARETKILPSGAGFAFPMNPGRPIRSRKGSFVLTIRENKNRGDPGDAPTQPWIGDYRHVLIYARNVG